MLTGPINLGDQPSLFSVLLAEIRDVDVQQDRMRFRRNLERLGEMFAYEISRTLDYSSAEISTPLGKAPAARLQKQPVVASILRAGLPLHQGLLNYFDRAENTFISAYRKHHGDSDQFDVEIEYLSSPQLDDKIVVLCDPMLATGSSMVLAYRAMLQRGTPRYTHVVAIIASRQGIDYVQENLPDNSTIWVGAVDPELTARGYIVPGLGDAGDLAYGTKE